MKFNEWFNNIIGISTDGSWCWCFTLSCLMGMVEKCHTFLLHSIIWGACTVLHCRTSSAKAWKLSLMFQVHRKSLVIYNNWWVSENNTKAIFVLWESHIALKSYETKKKFLWSITANKICPFEEGEKLIMNSKADGLGRSLTLKRE